MRSLLLLICALCVICGAPLRASEPTAYFSPVDQTLPTILDFVHGAKSTLLVSDYAFVWPDLTDALIAAQARGVKVECVFDKVQAAGKAEIPELAKLKAAGVPFVTGSAASGHIHHDKFIVRDGVDLLSGSFNFTLTAAKEDNNFLIFLADPALAGKYTAKFRADQARMLAK